MPIFQPKPESLQKNGVWGKEPRLTGEDTANIDANQRNRYPTQQREHEELWKLS